MEEEKENLALIMLPGVQYYTGQKLDMETITRYRREQAERGDRKEEQIEKRDSKRKEEVYKERKYTRYFKRGEWDHINWGRGRRYIGRIIDQ